MKSMSWLQLLNFKESPHYFASLLYKKAEMYMCTCVHTSKMVEEKALGKKAKRTSKYGSFTSLCNFLRKELQRPIFYCSFLRKYVINYVNTYKVTKSYSIFFLSFFFFYSSFSSRRSSS